MEVIARGRQAGKTTELIKRSAATGYYILTADHIRAEIVAQQAREMGYDIPMPVALSDYTAHRRFQGSYIKNIYIDDADEILKRIFYKVQIEAVTITDKRYWPGVGVAETDHKEKERERMSRHEEFKKATEIVNNNFETMSTKGAFDNNYLIMLTEIAESLAIIADSLREINARQTLKDI